LPSPPCFRHSGAVIFLFTDFGYEGPYVGQMHAVLAQQAPGVPVIDLMHDAPAHDPRAAAYPLAALALLVWQLLWPHRDRGAGGQRRRDAARPVRRGDRDRSAGLT